MIRTLRVSIGSLSLVAVGVWACSSAAAADGDSSATATRSALRASTKTNPPSVPADAPPPPRKPPQEAFDACKGSTEGAACSVTFHDHTLTGTCKKGPNGEAELACVPDRPPGPPPQGAPATGSDETIDDTTLEQRLDRLEKDIGGARR